MTFLLFENGDRDSFTAEARLLCYRENAGEKREPQKLPRESAEPDAFIEDLRRRDAAWLTEVPKTTSEFTEREQERYQGFTDSMQMSLRKLHEKVPPGSKLPPLPSFIPDTSIFERQAAPKPDFSDENLLVLGDPPRRPRPSFLDEKEVDTVAPPFSIPPKRPRTHFVDEKEKEYPPTKKVDGVPPSRQKPSWLEETTKPEVERKANDYHRATVLNGKVYFGNMSTFQTIEDAVKEVGNREVHPDVRKGPSSLYAALWEGLGALYRDGANEVPGAEDLAIISALVNVEERLYVERVLPDRFARKLQQRVLDVANRGRKRRYYSDLIFNITVQMQRTKPVDAGISTETRFIPGKGLGEVVAPETGSKIINPQFVPTGESTYPVKPKSEQSNSTGSSHTGQSREMHSESKNERDARILLERVRQTMSAYEGRSKDFASSYAELAGRWLAEWPRLAPDQKQARANALENLLRSFKKIDATEYVNHATDREVEELQLEMKNLLKEVKDGTLSTEQATDRLKAINDRLEGNN